MAGPARRLIRPPKPDLAPDSIRTAGLAPPHVRAPNAERGSPGASTYPLLITGDERILDDLIRLAAAAGTELTVASDVGAARASWADAPLVLVGADQAGPLARTAPPRRGNVIVVGYDLERTLDWRRAVHLGADDVVSLPEQEAWLTERMADAVESPRREATAVGVIGGRGGAGASTLAAALARTAAVRGHGCVLVDADPLGGGIDLVLGAEERDGPRWPDLLTSSGRVPASALRSALPCSDGVLLLSWDRGPIRIASRAAVRSVLRAARRLGDLMVVDLPRYLDEAAEEALGLCTTLLLVVPAEVRAAAAAGRVAQAALALVSDVRVVVRGPAPAGLTAADVAEGLGLPLAGRLEAEPGLAAALERGEPPARSGKGPLARLCQELLDNLCLPAQGAA